MGNTLPFDPNADAVRDMNKYANLRSSASFGGTDNIRLTYDMKMFRAQRNFYIAGFSVFLFL